MKQDHTRAAADKSGACEVKHRDRENPIKSGQEVTALATFAMRIKELRHGRGLSQPQLAAEIGVSKQTISLWERGPRRPEFETLAQLSQYFGVSVGYLLGETEGVEAGETDTAEEKVDVERVKALTEKLLRLSADSLDIVEGTIETAYKRDREKGRLRLDEGFVVEIK